MMVVCSSKTWAISANEYLWVTISTTKSSSFWLFSNRSLYPLYLKKSAVQSHAVRLFALNRISILTCKTPYALTMKVYVNRLCVSPIFNVYFSES